MPTIRDRLFDSAIKNTIPLTSAFELTPICNFACKMCYVRKTTEEVKCAGGLKSLDFWIDIARQAKEAGTLFPLLTGGETFLYPHIRELYEEMCKMGMQVSINSNGSCINENTIRWLKEMPPARINITLYGGSNKSYEKLCGDAYGFDKVRHGVDLLAKNDIRFKFNCSLTPDNAHDVEKMIDFTKRYGMKLRIATYMFPPVRRTGQSGDYPERFSPEEAAYYQVLVDWKQLSPERFAILAKNAQHFTELTPDVIENLNNKEPRKMTCMAGKCSYWVDWQGNLSGCGMMDIPKIDLQEHSLKDAWQQLVNWTQNLRYSSICGNCVNRPVCFSCAAMVHNETGSFDGRPVYLCEKARYSAKYYREFMSRLPKEILRSVEESQTKQEEQRCLFDEDDTNQL
ncbi:MAG: radical SAM/SPASM domain-containing protein [Merdibacter sp.]